jgi:hypothetical protein
LAEVAEWDQLEFYEVEKNKEESKPIVKNLIKRDELPNNDLNEGKIKEDLEKLFKELEKRNER